MSGIQSVLNQSALDLQTTRYAAMDSVKDFGIDNQPQTGVQAADGKQEGKFGAMSKEDQKKFEDELKKINDSLVSYGKQIRIKYNEEAEQTYVEVVDTDTQKVVASRPPEFLIDLSVRMKEMVGFFMDQKL